MVKSMVTMTAGIKMAKYFIIQAKVKLATKK